MSKRGGGGFGQMQQLMKQAQAMQENMKKVQEETENRTVETESGGGQVKVVMTGKQVIKELTISKACVDPEDVEMLQDLVMDAVNKAVTESQAMVEKEMAKVTGGMNIPGMF